MSILTLISFIRYLKGRVYWLLLVLEYILAVYIIVMFTTLILQSLNGRLDFAKPITRLSRILDFDTSYTYDRNKKDGCLEHYWMVLPSWRKSDLTEKIELTRQEYSTARKGMPVTLVLRKGAFGFEWVESKNLKNSSMPPFSQKGS
ncbi:MAG: hypothetical protein WCG06_00735 [Candidatus Omnitrophota bacterium]